MTQSRRIGVERYFCVKKYRPARLHSLAGHVGWRAVTTTLCQSRLYPPIQGQRIWKFSRRSTFFWVQKGGKFLISCASYHISFTRSVFCDCQQLLLFVKLSHSYCLQISPSVSLSSTLDTVEETSWVKCIYLWCTCFTDKFIFYPLNYVGHMCASYI